MKRFALLAVVLFSWVAHGEGYKHGPDSMEQPGVPKGKVTKHTWKSEIFSGTGRPARPVRSHGPRLPQPWDQ